MNDDVLVRVRAALPELSKAEAQVARDVLADPEGIVSATVSGLARQARVSDATVVRFARSLGFEGLPDLRIALARDLSRRAVELEHSAIAEGEINPSDSLADIVAKLAFHEARSIEQTARLIDHEALDRVAHEVAGGASVAAFGVGASGLAAADFCQKLQRIGVACTFSPDTHLQLVHAALVNASTVAVGFSFGGHTAEVFRALSLASARDALTVAVTGAPESPIGRAADVVLLTSAREAQLRAAALASRMAQLAVVDFLFLRIAQLRFDDVETMLEQTRAAVDGQRI